MRLALDPVLLLIGGISRREQVVIKIVVVAALLVGRDRMRIAGPDVEDVIAADAVFDRLGLATKAARAFIDRLKDRVVELFSSPQELKADDWMK